MNKIAKLIQEHGAFIFDVDDTMLYTFRNGFHKMNWVAKALGYPCISFGDYAKWYGRVTFEECLLKWLPQANIQQVAAVYQEASASLPYKPVCDFAHLQALLCRRGKKTAILTNGHHDAKLMRKLTVCGTDFESLSAVWGAEDLPAPKPSPLAIQPAKALFGTLPLLYIGDGAVDRDMAREAGIGFLQVYTGNEPPQSGVPGIASLKEFIAILEE